MASKEVDELIREIKATGEYKVASSGRHHKVLDKKGRVLVDENGPIIISKTPSDFRWRIMTVKRLVAAGVLKEDPKKKAQTKQESGKQQHHLAKAEVQALKIEAVKRRNKQLADRSRELRARLDPLITLCGGWGYDAIGQPTSGTGVKNQELGSVAVYWGNENQIQYTPPSITAAAAAVSKNLRQGGTFSERNLIFWGALADAWEASADPREWYIELVRASKGLATTHVAEGPAVQLPLEVPQEQVEEKEVEIFTEQVGPAAKPHLALEAVYYMAVGNEHDPAQMDKVLVLGQKILDLELRR